jgi:septal ring factor EnvC (AmiA/AmiB activator)
MFRRTFTLVLVVLALGSARALAQTEDMKRTEEQLDALKAQIQSDEQQLERTRSAERATLRQLEQINRDISLREELVATYARRVGELDVEVDSVFRQIEATSEHVESLRQDYAERVRAAYKHGRMNTVALILAANSVNQMLVRVNYLRRYRDVRVRKRDQLEEASLELERRRERLTEILAQTQEMRGEAISENQRLADLRRDRTRVVTDLRNRSTEIEQELTAKRDAERNLQGRLTELREAAARSRAAQADGAVDAAFRELTGAFADNRGRLPWPADGTLIQRFGWTADPVYGTRVNNRMIFVATPAGVDIRAVFEGVIQDVDIMATYGRYVMVAHGDYWTVYGNLSSTSMQPGTVVSAGDVLGQTGSTATDTGSGYFFGLFRENDFTDPLPWLMPR